MSKIYNAIMGLAVGDALGVPYEFRQRDSFRAESMIGFGTHNQPAGTWSDDTSLTLATMESMTRRQELDLWDIMENFSGWLFGNKFTARGELFDVGTVTREAIVNFNEGYPPDKCGARGYFDNGNGSLMRILPLAFFTDHGKVIRAVSGLTHAHRIAQTACEIYVKTARELIRGKDILSAVNTALDRTNNPPKIFQRLRGIDKLKRENVKSGGYVADTLEAALWCVINSESYSECVLAAVNLGGDTDTTAAVAGGLAGICFGDIPDKWAAQLARKDYINKLCVDFERFIREKSEVESG